VGKKIDSMRPENTTFWPSLVFSNEKTHENELLPMKKPVILVFCQ